MARKRPPRRKRGLLIAFEGPNAAGKTTQRRLFLNWLESQGSPVICSKWGSSPLVKPLLKVRRQARSLDPQEMCLLQVADYRDRLDHQILPALLDGQAVIAEPYLFTAMAHDSARGVRLPWMLSVYRPLIWPDLTFYFSISAETWDQRIDADKPPKFYTAGQDLTGIADPFESHRQFTRRVIEAYHSLGPMFRCARVDAAQSIYQQHRAIRREFEKADQRPRADVNSDAIADWLANRPLPVAQLPERIS